MNIQQIAKNYVEGLDGPIAHALARTPFALRFFPDYGRTRRLIAQVQSMDEQVRRSWILGNLKFLLSTAYTRNRCYRVLYDRRGYHPDRLKSLAHFQDVPIVTKKDLTEFSLEERSSPNSGSVRTNTGGTSGEPLEFYADDKSTSREWAHMHDIWGRFGYNYRHLKLTLRGRNLGSRLLKYNAVHNEYVINTYADKHLVAEQLGQLSRLSEIRWLHGYPSVVADFCEWLTRHRPDLIEVLRRGLRGALLGSEFPAPHYRGAITDAMGVPCVSWYGHTEMCVLAYETASNEYVPFHSYGYCEALPMADGIEHLIGTSMWNLASPFIRYDTGDGIKSETKGGFIEQFSILNGRIGEFVVDRYGMNIGLTALIFGRHHAGFKQARHVQVRQSSPGVMDLLIVPHDPHTSPDDLMRGFDLSSVAIDVRLQVIEEPVRTHAGKTPLLVR